MSSVLQTPEVSQLLGQEKVHRNLFPAPLVEAALRRGEAELAARGSLVAGTGKRTGRSPKDKFTVKDAVTEDKIAWGSANQPFPPEKFDALYERVLDYLKGKELFVQDLFCGADPKYRLPIQVINEYAWHNLFVRQLFIRPTAEELKTHKPEFTIVSAPSFMADPKRDGTNCEVFVLVNFSKKLVAHRRHGICRRNEEVHLRGDELRAARARRVSHALLGEHWRRRRDRAVLRTFRHRQDHTLRRSRPPPDWRRRARLERDRRLQLRRRLLRQVHSPLAENEPQIYNALRFGSVLENVVLDPVTRVPIMTTTARPRTRALRTRSSTSTTPSFLAVVDIPRTWSS